MTELTEAQLLKKQMDLSWKRRPDTPKPHRQNMNITYPNPIPIGRHI